MPSSLAKRLRSLALAACAFQAALVPAVLARPADAPAAAPIDRQPLAVAGAHRFDMTARGSGRTYRIFVSVPQRPPPAGGYGVLYVLDANARFLTAMETVRAHERRPDAGADAATLVVGIGYPDGVDVAAARTYDLTPTPSRDPRVKAPAGGADAFLDFIERDLKPAVAGFGPVDASRQAIFGHSFAGLFVLHSLVQRPDAFPVRIAASPSLWFDQGRTRQRLIDYAKARGADAPALRVLLTAGEFEQRLSPAAQAAPGADKAAADLGQRAQVDNARAVAEALAAAPGLRARFDEIAGEDHGTVVPAAIGRGVAWMLSPPKPVPAVPDAQAYWNMTPQQRYDLRLQVRGLDDADRIPWLTRLKQTLHDGLSAEQVETLHAERNRMDRDHDTRPHAVNAPK